MHLKRSIVVDYHSNGYIETFDISHRKGCHKTNDVEEHGKAEVLSGTDDLVFGGRFYILFVMCKCSIRNIKIVFQFYSSI
jgi:hypothetical protein